MAALKILYVHNCGVFGGGDRSLLELISAFPQGIVKPFLISPKGDTITYFKKKGIQTLSTFGISQFDNTRYSHYQSVRWLILLREITYLPSTLLVLLKAKKLWGKMDIIHFNELTLLPTIWICRKIFKNVPVVIHVRSVQMSYNQLISKYINSYLLKQKITLVAIDETVKNSLSPNLTVSIVYNGMNVAQNDFNDIAPNSKFDIETLTLGYVGNFLKLKGILELLKAVNECIENGMKLKLILVGYRASNLTFFTPILKILGLYQDMEKEVKEFISASSLKNRVELAAFTLNIGEYYKKMDILCFPTYLNACGRPVLEAALYGKPSIVAIDKDINDTIINNQTGICIKDNNPEKIIKAINEFYYNRSKIITMGKNAQSLARSNFDVSKNALKMIEIYRTIS